MLSGILLIIAFILFLLAALPISTKLPISLVPAGLACWVLSVIVSSGLMN